MAAEPGELVYRRAFRNMDEAFIAQERLERHRKEVDPDYEYMILCEDGVWVLMLPKREEEDD